MAPKSLNILRILNQPSDSVTLNGVNALDLIDSPEVSTPVFTRAIALLQANYGTEFSREKTALLFDMIREDGWTKERFDWTFKWFLKNKPYPSWTISDWFSYGVKVYPYSWYLAQCKPGEDVSKQMDKYRLPDGTDVYKWKDADDLPFKKVEFGK
jgi:hypothetical protein